MATRWVTSSDGLRLAVHESGNAAGPVIVAVHGFPDNHHVWDGIAAELGDEFRFVAYDVRGAGESDKPVGGAAYRIPQLGEDLAAVIDAVSPDEPVHVLGHDWGSMQLWDPLAGPELSRRVATFTSISGPSLDYCGVWLRDRRHVAASLRQLVASTYIVAFQVPRVPEAVLRRAPIERVTGREFRRSAADRTNAVNLYRANVLPRVLRPRPRPVCVPVHVIAPVDDPYARLRTATEAPVPYVADLTVEQIPGGHWVVARQPGLVAGSVRAYLRRRTG